jgi:hypothetical protein
MKHPGTKDYSNVNLPDAICGVAFIQKKGIIPAGAVRTFLRCWEIRLSTSEFRQKNPPKLYW